MSTGRGYIINAEGKALLRSHRLTKREIDVVEVCLNHGTTPKAAAAMFICEKAVKFHLTNIYKKLDLREQDTANGHKKAALIQMMIPFIIDGGEITKLKEKIRDLEGALREMAPHQVRRHMKHLLPFGESN